MKAALLKEKTNESTGFHVIEVETIPKPKLQEPSSVLIKLSAAALNHRDVWMTEGLYPGLQFESILGADGAGVVVEVSNDVPKSWIGKKVLINSSYGWGKDIQRPASSFKILGSKPLPGTFAQFIACPLEQIFEIPSHLDFVQAASVPLAGLTAYRAVFTKGEVAKGKKVLVTGIGGGVALFALQFCVAVGAIVYVTSSSEAKIKRAIELGAAGGANYTEENWLQKLTKESGGNFDAIIDGSGGEAYSGYLRILKNGGIISVYGSTAGGPGNLLLPVLFLKNSDIRGTAMGSRMEFVDMLKLIDEKKIVPVVDSTRAFDQIVSAFEEMRQGKQFGKLVIDIEGKARL